MPVCEADPWRLQFFEGVPCPPEVRVPTEDADAWCWYPRHRWVYDKLAVAQSQGLEAAPHGVLPAAFPVFSKPVYNLRGMGTGSQVLASAAQYYAAQAPGHFWMRLLTGEHVSTDVALIDGEPVWWRHATGDPGPGGTFDLWTIHAARRPALEAAAGAWLRQNLRGHTGMVNLESIGGSIIEVHLRFADQWPDLYGAGWVEALIGLYAGGVWSYPDTDRRDGFSVVLFGRHGPRYRHPPARLVDELRTSLGISSIQITFHEGWEPARHAMPPGGFRLAIVNCHDLAAGRAACDRLAASLIPR
ncbi:MAG: hypothetical protein JO209_06590 [Acidisphaera sp.]|nr:hypothetical protein [Acidisphaera sp.]